MKKILAVLLLIPSLAFGEVMIYFYATPTFVVNRLQNLSARPNLAGGSAAVQAALQQAIIVATDPDVNNVAYATLIPNNLLTGLGRIRSFSGRG